MTDKVQKIREEVERIQLYTRSEVLKQVLDYIDEVQKEPTSNPAPNEKMSVERWKKACDAACSDRNYRSHYGLTETRDDYFVDGVQWADEHPKEEPVSDVLDEAAFDYAESCKYEGGEKLLCIEHFKAGADWKEQKFEKNRLAACDRQTEEEAEIEQSFVIGIIEREHRQPTFDDAIKYGMRLQKEQMIAKAIDAVVSQVPCSNEIILYNPSSVDKYYLPQEMNKLGLNKGDKIKLVIIKED